MWNKTPNEHLPLVTKMKVLFRECCGPRVPFSQTQHPIVCGKRGQSSPVFLLRVPPGEAWGVQRLARMSCQVFSKAEGCIHARGSKPPGLKRGGVEEAAGRRTLSQTPSSSPGALSDPRVRRESKPRLDGGSETGPRRSLDVWEMRNQLGGEIPWESERAPF